MNRTDWQQRPDAGVDAPDTTNPLTALDLLRTRLRTRHYSYRTECIYVDWVGRFLKYAATRQGVPTPRVDTEGVRDFLTHLAVNRQVSASTQNQAFSALLFLCREVLGIPLDDVLSAVKANRGQRRRWLRQQRDFTGSQALQCRRLGGLGPRQGQFQGQSARIHDRGRKAEIRKSLCDNS